MTFIPQLYKNSRSCEKMSLCDYQRKTWQFGELVASDTKHAVMGFRHLESSKWREFGDGRAGEWSRTDLRSQS